MFHNSLCNLALSSVRALVRFNIFCNFSFWILWRMQCCIRVHQLPCIRCSCLSGVSISYINTVCWGSTSKMMFLYWKWPHWVFFFPYDRNLNLETCQELSFLAAYHKLLMLLVECKCGRMEQQCQSVSMYAHRICRSSLVFHTGRPLHKPPV